MMGYVLYGCVCMYEAYMMESVHVLIWLEKAYIIQSYGTSLNNVYLKVYMSHVLLIHCLCCEIYQRL